MSTIDPGIQRFIERLGHVFEQETGSRMHGRVLAWMLVTDDPQSLDEIAQVLQVSKAAASLSTRFWERAGIIERVRIPGDRRAYYRQHPAFMRSLIDVVMKQIAAILAVLEEGRQALERAGMGPNPGLDKLARVYAHLHRRLPQVLRELDEEAVSSRP